MAHATVNAMASVAVIAMRKVAPQDVARAPKVIPKRAVMARAKVDVAAVVVAAAVVVVADAGKVKVHHKVKVKAKATASVLTPKESHKAQM